jgi:aminopeptidase N
MPMKRVALLVAMLLFVASTPALSDTYPRQPGVDVVHYVFNLELLNDGNDEIRGESAVTVRFVAAGVAELFLDLASASNGKGMTVASVARGDRPAEFEHRADRLRIPLSPAPAIGDEITFVVSYSGIPADGLRLIPNIHGDRTAFSENWPNKARQWLPMIDHPYDKATGEFVVTTPAKYQVIANGLLVEELDLRNGMRRTHWKQSQPIASWLYAVGVAQFAVHHAGTVNGIPLQSWVFPQDRETGYRLFEQTSRQAVEFFSERIAPYPYEKLANVQAAGIGGGTEHATAIFYGEKGVAAGRGPVVHEIAHMWWGDAVTESDWDDVWLSEGFATYFTHLYVQHYDGRDAFVAGLRRDIDTVLQAEQKMPDTPIVHRNLDDMRRVLNRFVYQKGSWVLHMMRRLVGDEAFWNGIRTYYRRYEHGNASTDDLRQIMERASGADLEWFFRQWLNRPGVPRIEGGWSYDAARKEVRVEIAQTHEGEPFVLPIELRIVSASPAATRVERVRLEKSAGSFVFPADAEPVDVVLDPDTWLLIERGPFAKR